MLASVSVRIDKEVEELWQNFNKITTEMVISKDGRKPFPNFDFQVTGLELEKNYCILLKMKDLDQKRYRFTDSNGKSRWHGVAQPKSEQCEDVVIHKEGIQKGSEWMENFFSFENIKFTNCKNNKKDNKFYLQSMHKYRPHLEIYHIREQEENDIKTTNSEEIKEKVMIDSRGYQNEEVINLKVETNKYASGHLPKQNGKKEKKTQQQTPTPSPVCFSQEFNQLSQQPQNSFNSNNTGYNPLNLNQFAMPPFMNQQMMMAYMMNQWQMQQAMQNQYQNDKFKHICTTLRTEWSLWYANKAGNLPQQNNQMQFPSNFMGNLTPDTTRPNSAYAGSTGVSAPIQNNPMQFPPTSMSYPTPNVSRPNSVHPGSCVPGSTGGSAHMQNNQMQYPPTSMGYPTPDVSRPNSVHPGLTGKNVSNQNNLMQFASTSMGYPTPDISRQSSAYPGSTTAHSQPNPSPVPEDPIGSNFHKKNDTFLPNMSFENQPNQSYQKMPDFSYR